MTRMLRAPSQPYTDKFVAHPLPHITTVDGNVVRMFDRTCAGLPINDLDNDGDLGLVLANLAGPNAIFWNGGGINLRKQNLDHGDSRAVAVIDVDGDGWQDIVFRRRLAPPS
jgi:enediyne biosynthesis protein E4